jgi:hypothetical protein
LSKQFSDTKLKKVHQKFDRILLYSVPYPMNHLLFSTWSIKMLLVSLISKQNTTSTKEIVIRSTLIIQAKFLGSFLIWHNRILLTQVEFYHPSINMLSLNRNVFFIWDNSKNNTVFFCDISSFCYWYHNNKILIRVIVICAGSSNAGEDFLNNFR